MEGMKTLLRRTKENRLKAEANDLTKQDIDLDLKQRHADLKEKI
jgi:hypothetical protein